ncbi:G5 domain-containing protein [Actinomadura sp. GC306]|uniref:G5 domain-containing protein n=1 Tax=Actinomadura sp. GC306 TaxID=2530367 RepID=UPI001A9FC987|nr:G5 domain-containing protein [Actinomadura sp. GC306]
MGRTIPIIAAMSALLAIGACTEPGESPATSSNAAAGATTSPASEPATTSASPTPSPSIEQRTVTKTRKVPFKTRRVNDPTLAKGTTKVRQRGVAGIKTVTYKVTYTDGAKTDTKLVREVVTRKPVTRIIAVGTKRARSCDPNYSGCVPIASDVDCAGGSGNGPAYVQGPVRVIGSDIYDLDRDGDGIACDT